MSTVKTTIAGIDGTRRSAAGLAPSARRRAREAGLALFTVALLLLVAF
jgi:hypothetical protein